MKKFLVTLALIIGVLAFTPALAHATSPACELNESIYESDPCDSIFQQSWADDSFAVIYLEEHSSLEYASPQWCLAYVDELDYAADTELNTLLVWAIFSPFWMFSPHAYYFHYTDFMWEIVNSRCGESWADAYSSMTYPF